MNGSPTVANDTAGESLVTTGQQLAETLHDMGSPLTAMRVLLEVLRRTDQNSASRNELIGLLDNQVTEMAGCLESLLKGLAATDAGISNPKACNG